MQDNLTFRKFHNNSSIAFPNTCEYACALDVPKKSNFGYGKLMEVFLIALLPAVSFCIYKFA
jgi:hypothetical protein